MIFVNVYKIIFLYELNLFMDVFMNNKNEKSIDYKNKIYSLFVFILF